MVLLAALAPHLLSRGGARPGWGLPARTLSPPRATVPPPRPLPVYIPPSRLFTGAARRCRSLGCGLFSPPCLFPAREQGLAMLSCAVLRRAGKVPSAPANAGATSDRAVLSGWGQAGSGGSAGLLLLLLPGGSPSPCQVLPQAGLSGAVFSPPSPPRQRRGRGDTKL